MSAFEFTLAPIDAAALAQPLARGGYEELVQLRAAKAAAGRVVDRQLDGAVHLSAGRVTHDAGGAVIGIPQATVGIDAGTVGPAGAGVGEHAFARRGAAVGPLATPTAAAKPLFAIKHTVFVNGPWA